MRTILFTLLLIMTSAVSFAQASRKKIPGVYYVTGLREIATGLELHKDSTFEFFFVYGGLDRMGSGRWSYRNNRLILNTRKRPATDFLLVESKQLPGDRITIQMGDENPIILSNVTCVLTTPKTTFKEDTNQYGLLSFPLQEASKLSMIFAICPDRFSDFAMVKTHNYYRFTLQPWISEVFMEDFKLSFNKKGNLVGGHPLMVDPGGYLYEKSTEKLAK